MIRGPLLILAAAATATGLVAVTGCSPGAALAAEPLTIDVHLKYSQFVPAALTVPAGRPVRFVLHNDDFIDHEFIVGDGAVQRAHETGTEEDHGATPTEVDVPAGESVATVVTFKRGSSGLRYACHVPGHYAYAMVGTLTLG